jgi:hypothetical protein
VAAERDSDYGPEQKGTDVVNRNIKGGEASRSASAAFVFKGQK